jgi:hypothetical protein
MCSYNEFVSPAPTRMRRCRYCKLAYVEYHDCPSETLLYFDWRTSAWAYRTKLEEN